MDSRDIIKRLQDLEIEKRMLLAEYERICKAEWLAVNRVEVLKPQHHGAPRDLSVLSGWNWRG